MENSGYIGLSRQMAMRRQLDVLANNLANMNTTAFKGERVLFEEYLMRTGAGARSSFVLDYGTVRDTRAGKLAPTGNPLDAAIAGQGFFAVETPQGERYTRQGQFRADAQGRLATQDGHTLRDTRDRPIKLDRNAEPAIARDGTVSAGGQTLGRLKLVAFENERALRKVEHGLFAAQAEPRPAPPDSQVLQGMLESSNVEPIVEMTNLIELQRQYQSVQRLMDTEHERQRKTIERLGRIA